MSESAIENATRIFYSIPEISGDLKVFWSQLLKTLAHDDLTDSQVEQREIIGASHSRRSLDAALFFSTLPELEQKQIYTCLTMICEKAEVTKETRALRQLLSKIPTEHTKEIKDAFEKRLQEFNTRQHFYFDGTISHITIDFVVKWCMLIGIAITGIDASFNLLGAQFISIITLFIGWRISRRDQGLNTAFVKENFRKSFWKLSVRYSRLQYTMLAGYAICSSIIAFVIAHEGGSVAAIITFIVVCLFYYTLCVFFPVGRFTTDELTAQLQDADKVSNLDADENDEAIVRLEAKLQAQNSRLEAYVLESALFGALAFSGFLQIIATNLISFSDLENFARGVFHCLHGILTGNGEELAHYARTLDTKESLFCLVSIETLICSGLFLAVIASRLRFSNFSDSVRSSLSLAKAYNDKEEGIIQQGASMTSANRLAEINHKINFHLRNAAAEFGNITPVTSYMEYFRHAGVLVFLLVLITSCLFVSAFLSWTFFAAAIVTGIYFNLKLIRRVWNEKLFAFRIFFASNSWSLFGLTVLLSVAAFFVRITFNSNFTDLLLIISLFALAVLLYTWLAMMPHHDKNFGDIENLKSEPWRSSRYKVIRTVYGFAVIIAVIGVALKVTGTNSADEMLLIGLTLVSLASYPLGYYLSRPRWLGILTGMLIGTSAMGTLFRMLHFMGGSEMLQLAVGAQVIFFVVFFIRRRSFHYILFRVVVAIVVVTFLMSGQTSYLRQASLMYEHADMDRRKLANFFYEVPFTETAIDETLIRKAIASCDSYFMKYDQHFRSTSVHRRWWLFFETVTRNHVFDDINVYTKDPEKIKIADLASSQLQKIDPESNPLLRVNVLIAMQRKDEAAALLDVYVKRHPSLDLNETIKDLYAKVSLLKDSMSVSPVVTKAIE